MRNSRLAAGIALIALTASHPMFAASAAAPKWAVQVDEVNPGEANIEPAFRVAIYENLLGELTKTRQFKRVLRSGDRGAGDIKELLVLKITVQRYQAGNETKRAVTTVAGATKINVKSQLVNRDGKVVLEKVVDGNVRFFGANLRATHNLAHNVAKAIKESDSAIASGS
jgi:Domain of unknown function (DUF4410)